MLKARHARKPTVAVTVLKLAAPATVIAQPAMRATTHSHKKEDKTEDEPPHIYDHEHDKARQEQDEDEYDQLADLWLMPEPVLSS